MRSLRAVGLLGGLLVSGCDTATYSMAGTSAANPPIAPGRAAAAQAATAARLSAAEPAPPDAQLLYQSSAQDAFGRSSHTGLWQQRGAVAEETYIGNQPLHAGQTQYPPRVIDGVVQPGYVPSGTTIIYDPVTGRMIPVRRR